MVTAVEVVRRIEELIEKQTKYVLGGRGGYGGGRGSNWPKFGHSSP